MKAPTNRENCSIKQITRSKTLLAKPIALVKAFSDESGIMALLDKGSPYKTLAAVHKNVGETSAGWFRNFWALGGKVVLPGAESYFNNPIFIEAAQASFKAEIIRPVAMMTNFNLPAPGAETHLDLPFFRGLQNREVPSWMLATMGYSGLFHDWAMPVASAITWFYEGEGGEFEYWPHGRKSASVMAVPPFSNQSVLADNEYMYHRVGAIGPVSKQQDYEDIAYDAKLHLCHVQGKRLWQVRNDEHVQYQFTNTEVRTSILWKAFCFKNQAEADAFDDHRFDLNATQVAELFEADMNKRGLDFKIPIDPNSDPDWKSLITSIYNRSLAIY